MEILISRPKQFADYFRKYAVLVDGKVMAKLAAGEEIRIVLPENSKILSASIDWCSSNKFQLSELSESQKIVVKNVMGKKLWLPFYILYAISILRKSYLIVEKAAENG